MNNRNLLSIKNNVMLKKTKNPMDLMDWCVDGIPFSNEEYKNYILNDIFSSVNISKSDILLDLGCGCGYLLKSIEDKCKYSMGVEISKALIEKKVCKSEIIENDIISFRTEHKFSKIICYSVALLFPNMEYLCNVIEKIICLLKPGGEALIGDIQFKKHHFYLIPNWEQLFNTLSKNKNVTFRIENQSSYKRKLNNRLNLKISKF